MPGQPIPTGASTVSLLSITSLKPSPELGTPAVTAWRSESSAPNCSACLPARRASSAPPIPLGKPKKFSIFDV